jgi:Tfp pilus assembly major pilin PilA
VTISATTGDRTPSFPPGRYGRRRAAARPHRWLFALMLVAMIAATVAIGLRLYRQYGRPAYVPQVLAVTQITDQAATVRFEVRKADTAPATCRVRARSQAGIEVGHADVVAPAGLRVEVTYTLATSERAFAIEVPACRPVGR